MEIKLSFSLHNLDLFLGQAVEVVYQAVDLSISSSDILNFQKVTRFVIARHDCEASCQEAISLFS